MLHESNFASHEQCQGNDHADQQPATTMPPTVLVTELDNGSLILQGRPVGPQVWLSPDGAVPLKHELAAVFGRTNLAAAGRR